MKKFLAVLLFVLLTIPASYAGFSAGSNHKTVNTNGVVANFSTDSFARLRISEPTSLFNMFNEYNTASLLFEDIVNGTGVITALPNESSVQLSTGGTASGAYAYRQSRQYFRYQPGKTQQIILTRVVGAIKTNVRQRWGYFDASNGLFFEQDGTNLKVVERTSTSGSPSDANVVTQANWNGDKLDGSGASGFVLDTSKENIYFIQFQWLGSGDASFGVYVNGVPVIAHTFHNSNSFTVPYMTTPNLPIRNEIENTGVAASTTVMKATCNAVISEGGTPESFSYAFSASNGITEPAITTRRALISIRPKATFNGKVVRGEIELHDMDLTTKTNDVFWELVYNPTFTGTPTWTSVDANSITEYSVHGDAAAGAFTGGIVVDSGFVAASQGSFRSSFTMDFTSRYPVVLDNAGANPRAFSLVVTSFTGTATSSGSLSWNEEY